MVNKFPLFLRIQEIFTNLTEHVALTFKVSTFQFVPLSHEDGRGGGGGGSAVQDKNTRGRCLFQVTAFILRFNHNQK